MAPERLDELDRRIVAALQVDGRASWRRIAAVLGAPDRTVARRGAALMESEVVRVHGFVPRGEMLVLRLHCTPGALRLAATSLALRQDTTFTYLITGAADCAAEVNCPQARLPALLLDELPGTPGVLSISTSPALRYYRAAHEWRPGVLDDAEVAELAAGTAGRSSGVPTPRPLGRDEQRLATLLADDGRRSGEDLAVLTGLSEPTVRRKLDAMRSSGALYLRAVVDPALLGLPVEALLWIKASPRAVDVVGSAVIDSPSVRYAVALAGEHQLLVHVAVADTAGLHRVVTDSPWVQDVDAIETSVIFAAPKRTGVLDPSLRGYSAR